MFSFSSFSFSRSDDEERDHDVSQPFEEPKTTRQKIHQKPEETPCSIYSLSESEETPSSSQSLAGSEEIPTFDYSLVGDNDLTSASLHHNQQYFKSLESTLVESLRQSINQDLAKSFEEMTKTIVEKNHQAELLSAEFRANILSSIQNLTNAYKPKHTHRHPEISDFRSLSVSNEPENYTLGFVAESYRYKGLPNGLRSKSEKINWIRCRLPEEFSHFSEDIDFDQLEQFFRTFQTLHEIRKTQFKAVTPDKANWTDAASDEAVEAFLEYFSRQLLATKQKSILSGRSEQFSADLTTPAGVNTFIWSSYSCKWLFFLSDKEIWQLIQSELKRHLSDNLKLSPQARILSSCMAYQDDCSKINWSFLLSASSTFRPNPGSSKEKILSEVSQFLTVEGEEYTLDQYGERVHSDALLCFQIIQNWSKTNFNASVMNEILRMYRKEQNILCEYINLNTNRKVFTRRIKFPVTRSEKQLADASWWASSIEEIVDLLDRNPQRFCSFFKTRIYEICQQIDHRLPINQHHLFVTYWNTRLVGTIKNVKPIPPK